MSTHTAEQVHSGSALYAAAKTEVELLPDDWRKAKFTIEIERGEKGPLISVGHEITGDTFKSSGELCDCEAPAGERSEPRGLAERLQAVRSGWGERVRVEPDDLTAAWE